MRMILLVTVTLPACLFATTACMWNGSENAATPIAYEPNELLDDLEIDNLQGDAILNIANRTEANITDSTRLVVRGNNVFAVDLYRQLSRQSQGKNLFFSPYSISTALMMTAEGASDKTLKEMIQTLRVPSELISGRPYTDRIWNLKDVHKAFATIDTALVGSDADRERKEPIRQRLEAIRTRIESIDVHIKHLSSESRYDEIEEFQRKQEDLVAQFDRLSPLVDYYEIHTANALWGERTFPFNQDFVDTVDRHYKTGGIFPVDFKSNPRAAKQRINDWTASQTRDRIKEIISNLPPRSRLILTNAIYFKGDWSVPFEESQTKPRDFTMADGIRTDTPTMHQYGMEIARYGAFNADGSTFNTPWTIDRNQQDHSSHYPDANGFLTVELPYKGEALSMILLVPNRPDGLSALEAKLSADALDRWIEQMQKRETNIFLPRFKMETEYKLTGVLQAMGMRRAFIDPLSNTQFGADFSGMNDSMSINDRLYIDQVLHKGFIEVNEKGTEAAAVTAVMMVGSALAPAPPTMIPFIPTVAADRPFLYLIRDRETGSILFLGRMMEPVR